MSDFPDPAGTILPTSGTSWHCLDALLFLANSLGNDEKFEGLIAEHASPDGVGEGILSSQHVRIF